MDWAIVTAGMSLEEIARATSLEPQLMRLTTTVFIFLVLSCTIPPAGECTEGNCTNGQGVYEYADGSVLRAIFEDGAPVHGVLVDPEGDIYTGTFTGWERDGYGIYELPSQQSRYAGQYTNDKAEGFGAYGFLGEESGEYYAGTWEDNERDGYGEYYNPEDGRHYYGQMRDGSFAGVGFYERVLEGSLDPFEFRYIGEFRDNSMHGRGLCVWPDGRRFVGEWRDGEMREGVMYSGSLKKPEAGGDIYTGEFQDGLPHGRGTYAYRDGRRYTGEFQNGEYHGYGVILYPSTFIRYLRYEGQFENGEFHGQGKLIYKDGTVQEGRFEAGSPVEP